MHQLRFITLATCCTLFVASAVVAGPSGARAGNGSAGGHASPGSGGSNASRTTRYDNPHVLHYLEPASGYGFTKYEGCGAAKTRPGCVPTQAVELLSLRDQGLRLQEADGGRLSPAHRAALQSKLDAIRTQPK
jgi:hypothetical protein